MFQLTPTRLRSAESSWRATINRFRGPVPGGLGVAHLVAESNGEEDPRVRDARRRPIGIMQVPWREGRRFGYKETDLKIPTNNIYVWAQKYNRDAYGLHNDYPNAWTKPGYDFWLSVRLVFIIGRLNFDNLFTATSASSAPDNVISTIQTWIRTKMKTSDKFGLWRLHQLKRVADHLDAARTAMILLDGPNYVSEVFSQAPGANPGNTTGILYATEG